MASNTKIKERQAKQLKKSAAWQDKFRSDMDKIKSTGNIRPHYVGGGQPYTDGKE